MLENQDGGHLAGPAVGVRFLLEQDEQLLVGEDWSASLSLVGFGWSSRSKTSIGLVKSRILITHIKTPMTHSKTRARFMVPCLPVTALLSSRKRLWPETRSRGLSMATINLRARPLQLGSRRPQRLLLPRSHKEGSARMMEVVSQQRDNVCPLRSLAGIRQRIRDVRFIPRSRHVHLGINVC